MSESVDERAGTSKPASCIRRFMRRRVRWWVVAVAGLVLLAAVPTCLIRVTAMSAANKAGGSSTRVVTLHAGRLEIERTDGPALTPPLPDPTFDMGLDPAWPSISYMEVYTPGVTTVKYPLVFYAVIAAAVLVLTSLRPKSKPGTCAECGYTLAGLEPGVPCPECGQANTATQLSTG